MTMLATGANAVLMRGFLVLVRAAGFLGLWIAINSCGGGGSPAGPAQSPPGTAPPSSQPVPPNITAILPSVPVVSPAEQRLTVNGTGLSAVTSISLTRPGGDVSTISGDKLRDLSETSLSVMATLATPGAYSMQASTATGTRSNSRTFDVSAPAEQGQFSTAITNASGEAVVAVSGVGNVPVAVRDQDGQGVSNATIVAHPGGIAVAAEGYTTTVILPTTATLRARSLSWSSVVISLGKTACAIKSALLDCAGLDLASHLAVGGACKAYESIDATFSCVEAPNMHRKSLVAQALVLNTGTFIDQLLSRIPLVGCGLWMLDETLGFSIQSYYVNLANRWYPELRGTDFLVVSTDTTDIFTPYACPVPLFPRALGDVSSGQWRGTFNWDTPNLMLRDERVRIWRGDACAGTEFQSISSQVVDALRELSLASAARPVASVRRSVEATLSGGAYAWRVESTRLDGSIETTTCSKLTVDSTSPPTPPTTHTLVVTKGGSGAGTVTSSPSGISCGFDCQESYAQGTVVTLAAVPASGSTFGGWSGDADCSDGSVTMSAAKSCAATFTLDPAPPPMTHTLTVSKSGTGSGTVTSSPAGISCGSDCQEAYAAGTAVTLTATPATGSTFGGWSGDADCSDGSVTMNAARSCVAAFNPQGPVDLYLQNDSSGEIQLPINKQFGIEIGRFTTGNAIHKIADGSVQITVRETSGFSSCATGLFVDIVRNSDAGSVGHDSVALAPQLPASSQYQTLTLSLIGQGGHTHLEANRTYYIFLHSQCSGGKADVKSDAAGLRFFGYVRSAGGS